MLRTLHERVETELTIYESNNYILVFHGHIVLSIVPDPKKTGERSYVPRGSVDVLEPRGHGKYSIFDPARSRRLGPPRPAGTAKE